MPTPNFEKYFSFLRQTRKGIEQQEKIGYLKCMSDIIDIFNILPPGEIKDAIRSIIKILNLLYEL